MVFGPDSYVDYYQNRYDRRIDAQIGHIATSLAVFVAINKRGQDYVDK